MVPCVILLAWLMWVAGLGKIGMLLGIFLAWWPYQVFYQRELTD